MPNISQSVCLYVHMFHLRIWVLGVSTNFCLINLNLIRACPF
jgi:hypothetical protein